MFAFTFPSYGPLAIGLLLGVAGLAIAIGVWRNHRRKFVATHGPTFLRLCDGLRVSRLDRWRLKRLASKAGLLTPAVLLISRGAFENALVRAAVHPDGRWPQSFKARMFEDESAQFPA